MKLDAPTLDWYAVLPEVLLAGAAMLALLTALGPARIARILAPLVVAAGFLGSGIVAWSQFGVSRMGEWAGQIDADPAANLVRILVAVAGVLTVLLAASGQRLSGREPEFYTLLAAAGCGMGMFAASGSLLTLFIGLELFSISLYVMCAIDAERSTSLEAGLKYLIIGGVSSAVLLYGIALVYGVTGELTLSRIGSATIADGQGLLFAMGAAMVIGGMAFKATAAPVHWWAPDVYEGAPTSVTAFMATATKVAALLAFARVVIVAFGGIAEVWEPVVAGLAVASILVGNVGALVQADIKRMLAYSGIAQAGYMLIGLVAWSVSGIAALAYALVAYVIVTMGVFALILMREQRIGRAVTYDDLRGLGWGDASTTSWLAVLPGIGMAILILSLAGIPPTAGFFAKFMLFDAAVRGGWEWLAVVGVIGSVVSLGYYLRIIVAMYFQAPLPFTSEDTSDVPRTTKRASRPAVVLATIGVLAAGVIIMLAVRPNAIVNDGCDLRRALTVMTSSADISCIRAVAADAPR